MNEAISDYLSFISFNYQFQVDFLSLVKNEVRMVFDKPVLSLRPARAPHINADMIINDFIWKRLQSLKNVLKFLLLWSNKRLEM